MKQLLDCELGLDFLLQVEERDLAQLVASVRGAFERGKR